MKRLLALLAILLISQVGYGQQKMDQLFNAFRGESDVTSVNIGNITMKLASLFTETMGVNGIEILEFDNCAQEVKDRLSTAIRNLRDPDYETMVTANERDSRTKVLVKIKEDMIRTGHIHDRKRQCVNPYQRKDQPVRSRPGNQ